MNIAAVSRTQGKNGQAIGTYKRALGIVEKTLGAQDPLAVEIREQINAGPSK
jgi:hypothetical protein